VCCYYMIVPTKYHWNISFQKKLSSKYVRSVTHFVLQAFFPLNFKGLSDKRTDDHIFEKTLKIEFSPIPQIYTLKLWNLMKRSCACSFFFLASTRSWIHACLCQYIFNLNYLKLSNIFLINIYLLFSIFCNFVLLSVGFLFVVVCHVIDSIVFLT
jgi:hypothetical protein